MVEAREGNPDESGTRYDPLIPVQTNSLALDVAMLTRVTLNEPGAIRSGELIASKLDFDLNGSGDSKIWVTDELDITITGSGSIAYRGNPAVTQTVTGSGDIVRLARQ